MRSHNLRALVTISLTLLLGYCLGGLNGLGITVGIVLLVQLLPEWS
jgi:TctA family transporter